MVLVKALTYVLAAGMPPAQPMPHDTTPARYVVPPDAQATGPPLSPEHESVLLVVLVHSIDEYTM